MPNCPSASARRVSPAIGAETPMGWFRQKKATGVTPDYTGLQLQTSVSTLPVPILWGQTKSAANVIWYRNFQTAGRRGRRQGRALRRAQIERLHLQRRSHHGALRGADRRHRPDLARPIDLHARRCSACSFFNGATPQTVWGYLAANYPAEALAYQGTAYVCAANYELGDDAVDRQPQFRDPSAFSPARRQRRRRRPGASDLRLSHQPAIWRRLRSGAASTRRRCSAPGGDASLQTYCRALGVAFSPALTDQEQGSSILRAGCSSSIARRCGAAGELKLIPYGDAPIAAGTHAATTVPTIVPTPTPAAFGGRRRRPSSVCGRAEFRRRRRRRSTPSPAPR